MNNQFYIIDGLIVVMLALICIFQQIYLNSAKNRIKELEMFLSVRKEPLADIKVNEEEIL